MVEYPKTWNHRISQNAKICKRNYTKNAEYLNIQLKNTEWCNTFLRFVNKAHIRSVPSPRINYYRKSILHYFIHYIIIMLMG